MPWHFTGTYRGVFLVALLFHVTTQGLRIFATSQIIFARFLQYGINSWVTHVASSCSSICGNKYGVKMFEVPVNFDPAKKESGALFAYVQSAAFLTFCETWSLSYTLHYLWPTCLKCPQYKATPPASSKFIKAHPIPFSLSPPDSPYHRSMLMMSSIFSSWVESPVQQATVEENNNTDPSTKYYYVCVLIVVVGGLANTSCHGLNFPTFRNNLLKAVETGESTPEKLRIWLSKYAGQIWLLIVMYEKTHFKKSICHLCHGSSWICGPTSPCGRRF